MCCSFHRKHSLLVAFETFTGPEKKANEKKCEASSFIKDSSSSAKMKTDRQIGKVFMVDFISLLIRTFFEELLCCCQESGGASA